MRYLLGDTETTGATAEDKVVELAWVEFDESLNVLDRQHSLIDPEIAICPSASGVHGITMRDVIEAPTIEEFFSILIADKFLDPICFIAHNVGFDVKYMKPFMPGIKETLCTLRLARRFFPDAPNHKLPTLMYYLNLERGKSHSAAGDVETTLDLLRKVVQESGLGLDGLLKLSKEPMWIKTWPMGKWRGKPIDIDKGYVKWALGPKGMTELDPDLRWSLGQVSAGVPIPI
jgi:DNA polymerase III epsilon subunit-like protein